MSMEKECKENTPGTNGSRPQVTQHPDNSGDIDTLAEQIGRQIVRTPEVVERLLDQPEFRGVLRKTSIFSGPLPPPGMLAQYNEILPGSAERILRLTEREQANRHQSDRDALSGAVRKDRRGQWMGFTLTLLVLLIATCFAWRGDKIFAGTLITIDLISLAAVFVTGKLFQHHNE